MRNLYILIDTRCLRFSFILRHARERDGEIGEILRRHGSRSRTVAHSFIYFLTYRCTRSCSRFIGAGPSPHGLRPCPCTTRFRCVGEGPQSSELEKCARIRERHRPQGETLRKTKMDFPPLARPWKKSNVRRDRAPFSGIGGDEAVGSRGLLPYSSRC